MGPAKPIRAAQYVRMSTEHQRYSIDYQIAAMATYALERGILIERTYADSGISGLKFENRAGLKALLGDVVSGEFGLDLILVYDVSRWGRFQDPDQSAHYEFLCRQAGIGVEYCAEAFDNDGSPMAAILKGLKRVMAAEYSRDLSLKVQQALLRVAADGYHAGGSAGYALRRVIVDKEGAVLARLGAGERKMIVDHRVRLVWGPAEEVETVRRIFRLFTITGMTQVAISHLLNSEGLLTDRGTPWTPRWVRGVLMNPRYAGVVRYNYRDRTLGSRETYRPPDEHVLVTGVLDPIVSLEIFERAQTIIANRYCRLTDAELLERLGALVKRGLTLSVAVINDAPDLPNAEVISRRLGGLKRVYGLIGYDRERSLRERSPHLSDEEMLQLLRELLEQKGRLGYALIESQNHMPSAYTYRNRFGSLWRAYELIGYTPPKPPAKPRPEKYQEEVMLEQLAHILLHRGRVDGMVLRRSPGTPSKETYRRRFGSLDAAVARAEAMLRERGDRASSASSTPP